VVTAIDVIEQQLPNKFEYHLFMDKGLTGRLEATVFPRAGCEGTLLHSKASTNT